MFALNSQETHLETWERMGDVEGSYTLELSNPFLQRGSVIHGRLSWRELTDTCYFCLNAKSVYWGVTWGVKRLINHRWNPWKRPFRGQWLTAGLGRLLVVPRRRQLDACMSCKLFNPGTRNPSSLVRQALLIPPEVNEEKQDKIKRLKTIFVLFSLSFCTLPSVLFSF